jgi:asparagine synthase (glutamine-hydrolysing)
MLDALVHRGPDGSGHWSDAEIGVVLGHRRLAVIDVSPQGAQPMVSECGRYVIVYNGEVYNSQELRDELGSDLRENDRTAGGGVRWRGHSDTEVLLAAIARWGVAAALTRATGMFAFAVWDRQDRVLFLARDRLGEKPLYYARVGRMFSFASELKALRTLPPWRGEIDRGALALFLRHGYIPAPYSIYKGVHKVPAGTFLRVDLSALQGGDIELVPETYWSAKDVAERGSRTPFQGSPRDAVTYLDALLRDAVGRQMVSDVPLGAFLSGGVDSSTIVAMMQAQSQRPVKTFSIGFDDPEYNEAAHAKAVARHLRTEHTELYVTSADALAVIPRLPTIFDEPFSDSSQIPTYLVAKLARGHVKVSLSGDGGDELFAGYNRYVWGRRIWSAIGWMPLSVRRTAANCLTAVSPQRWDRVFSALGPLVPSRITPRIPGDNLHKLAEVLSVESPEAVYSRLVSHWKSPVSVVLDATEPPTALTDRMRWADVLEFTQRMMYLDLVSYLPDDILVKVDRSAMHVSLETRVPFLDHRVVEFAWRVPLAMKLHNGQSKWILRQVLYQYVPRELIDRTKAGFAVPLHQWLRGSLRDWAEDLLAEKRLKDDGFFDPTPIRKMWEEHISGRRNRQYYLWDVLMFQAWLQAMPVRLT